MKDYEWNSIKCTGDIPPARSSQGCTIVCKDKILLFSGCDEYKDLSDAYILDLSFILYLIKIERKQWKKFELLENRLQFPLVGCAIANIPKINEFLSEQIIVFGGWDGKEYVNTTMIINGGNYNLMIDLTDIKYGNEDYQKTSPQGRKDHTLTYSPYDNKIYLYGGWNPLKWAFEEIFFYELWSLNDRIIL